VPLSDGRTAELRLPGRHAIHPAAKAAIKAVNGVLEVEQL
jgi:DNA polymerase-3 subunit alpha